jgi:hypothetical protein
MLVSGRYEINFGPRGEKVQQTGYRVRFDQVIRELRCSTSPDESGSYKVYVPV